MVMDEAMANLSQGTGGVLFHNNNDLNAGFRETSVAPEVTYRMSFSPEGVTADGGYHKLQVKLAHAASYSVEARPGYFAPEEAASQKLRESLDKEVMGRTHWRASQQAYRFEWKRSPRARERYE